MDGGVNPVYRKMLYSYTANLSIDFEGFRARYEREFGTGF